MEITYRLATIPDAPVLAQLRWDFRSYDMQDPSGTEEADFVSQCADYFREAFTRDEWGCWVAEVDGLIISTIFFHVIQKIPKPTQFYHRFAYISNVYTRPEYRNQGVGTALMERAKAWGVERGLEMFFLWPSKRSVPFYLRAGFHGDVDSLECPLVEA
jgi:GNAT superfamily N-acetyltransferase